MNTIIKVFGACLIFLVVGMVSIIVWMSTEFYSLNTRTERDHYQILQKFSSTCNLRCEHGGMPNLECSSCERCEKGWVGRFCNRPIHCMNCNEQNDYCACKFGGEFDILNCSCKCFTGYKGEFCAENDPNTSPSQFHEAFENFLLSDHFSSPSTPNSTPTFPGFVANGYNPFDRTIKPIKILETSPDLDNLILTPDGETRLGFKGVFIENIYNSVLFPVIGTQLFLDMFDFIRQNNAYKGTSFDVSLSADALSRLEEVSEILQKGHYSLVKNIYQINLFRVKVIDPLHTPLAPIATKAIQILSGKPYDQFKNTWQLFMRFSGGAVLTEATLGVEFINTNAVSNEIFENPGVDRNYLHRQGTLDFFQFLGEGNFERTSHYYKNYRSFNSNICRGGRATERSCKSPEEIKENMFKNPVPIQVKMMSLHHFVPIDVKVSFQKAELDFVQENINKWLSDHNPCPDCYKGRCLGNDTYCTCDNENIGGRSCTFCRNGGDIENGCEPYELTIGNYQPSTIAQTISLAPSDGYTCQIQGFDGTIITDPSFGCLLRNVEGVWTLTASTGSPGDGVKCKSVCLPKFL